MTRTRNRALTLILVVSMLLTIIPATLHAEPATDQITAFVTRFYQLFFDREPDSGGLNYWVSSLVSNEKTGADVSGFFVDSAEFRALNASDDTYLTMMYRAFFDRLPDDGGKAFWQDFLDNGMSRYWVLTNFVNSPEFQTVCDRFGITRGNLALIKPADLYPKITAFVNRFYKLTLLRPADADGLNYWVGELAAGRRTGAILARDFVFSDEFINRNVSNQNYLTIMYQAFFGRDADAGGRSYWIGQLTGGSNRYRVLGGFVNSAEFDGICKSYGIQRGSLPSSPYSNIGQYVFWGLDYVPDSLNSALATDTVAFDINRHLLEGLTKRDQYDSIVPGMAERWTVSQDGLTYLFTLRDAKWSNGDAVTASDFAFAFKVLLSPNTLPAPAEYAYFAYPIKNAEAFSKGQATWDQVGVRVVDAGHLEIKLERATPHLPDLLAFGVMAPINERYYNQVGAANYGVDGRIISNGAYTLTNWEQDFAFELTRNANYYDKANVSLINIDGYVEAGINTNFNVFNDGYIDVLDLPNRTAVTQAKNAGYNPVQYSDGATFYLELNLNRTALKNQKIRKAIAYGINRADFVTNVQKSDNIPALSFTSPSIRGAETGSSFRASVGSLLKDNAAVEAKSLYQQGLSELGVSSLALTLLCDNTASSVAYAQAIAGYLKTSIGLTLNIEQLALDDRLDRVYAKNFDLTISGWGPDYNDPMTFLDLFETGNGNNYTSYSSAAYDALLAQARSTLDDSARFAVYKQLEELLMADLPIVPLYHRVRSYALYPNLKGVVRTAFQDHCFLHAYMAG